LIKTLNEKLMPKMKGLFDKLINDGWFDKIGEIAETIGEAASGLIGVLIDNPIATVIGGILFSKAQWILNGISLAYGFMKGTGGMGGGGGMGDMFSNLFGGKGGKAGKFGVKGGSIGPALPKKGFGGMGKWGMGAKLGAGLGLGALGMGAEYGRGKMDDPNSGGGKALGVAGKAASWAGMGAMAGPWGALIGGLLGAGVGAYDEFFSDDARMGNRDGGDLGLAMQPKANDAIISGGKVTPIDKKDDLIAAKPNGAIDGMINTSSPTNMKIEFGEIHFKFDELKVSSPGNEKVSIDLLKDQGFIRDITKMIHVETTKAINGGKVSPSPK